MPELVVVFNARRDLVDRWARRPFVPDELTVLADPEGRAYKALGVGRASLRKLMSRGVVDAAKAAARGIYPRLTSADMLRLGADAAIRADGEIALLHRAQDAGDRLEPRRLADALA